MFKDLSSALVIVLILVIGGLAYLLLPGRLNGPSPDQTSTSTTANPSTIIIATTTSLDLQNINTYDNYEPSGS